MSRSPDLVQSLESIDRNLAAGVRHLHFSAGLERRYEADMRDERVRHLVVASLIGFVLYDIFLFSDWQMVPDVFREALIWRLGIFSPLTLAAIFIVSLPVSRAVREGVAAAFGVFCAIPILVLFAISHSPTKLTYHYGTVIIIMFVTVVQRVQFRYAVASVVGILGVQFFVIARSDVFNAAMIQSEITFYVTTAILILVATYMLEREMRRSYLLMMRGRVLNERLDHASKVDPLTGLWNRRHLNVAMEEAWRAAETAPRSMALILLDVDHFKLFNDTFGHVSGDACLQCIASCAQAALENTNGVAVRFGGEEFLIFLQGTDADEAHRVARGLRQAILAEAIPHGALGQGAIVTASFGVATGMAPDVSAEALVAAADVALYEAKGAGRNCIRSPAIDGENAASAATAAA